MTAQVKFISTMIQEKGFELEKNLLESEGHFGLTIQMLLDFIDGTDKQTKDKIRNMFSLIDFKNGDIMDYINFLAKGMVAALGY